MNVTTSSSSLFVAYDLEHIEMAVEHAVRGGEIVSLNFWVERALTRRGVAYRSYRDYQLSNVDDEPLATVAQTVAREWYRIPELRFFEHKSIPLGEALESGFGIYLGRLIHYRALIERIFDANPSVHLVVPYPQSKPSATTGPLTHFEMSVVVDVARVAAIRRNLPFDTIGEAPIPSKQHVHSNPHWHTIIVAMYNTLIGLVPRRKIKMYATEYWRNIAPCIERMDDVELILMERSELRNVPWWQIWKHRVRLMHPRDVANMKIRRVGRTTVEQFRKEWLTARAVLASHPIMTLVEWSLVEPALEYLVCVYAERVVVEAETFEKLLQHEKPDKVLLRVSISSYQTHFFILARMARRLGIPSIEIQHAGAHIDPRSVYSRLEADYLASYGSYVRGWYERMGVTGERIVSIGSPRFDRCILARESARAQGIHLLQGAGLNLAQPVLLFAVPDLQTDSYELANLFRTVRVAQERILGLQIILKFRNTQRTPELRDFVHETFPTAMVCMDKEDLFSLLCVSSVVVCGNSTVLYEALLARVPLLLHPWRMSDTYHAKMYAPAAPILYSASELVDAVVKVFRDSTYRTELLMRQDRFLEGYSFDGRSSERLIALLSMPLTPYSL